MNVARDPFEIEALATYPVSSVGAVGVPIRAIPDAYPPSGLGDLPRQLLDDLGKAISTGVSTISGALRVDPDALAIYARRVQGTPQTISPQLQRQGVEVHRLADTFREKGPIAGIADAFAQMQSTSALATSLLALWLLTRVIR